MDDFKNIYIYISRFQLVVGPFKKSSHLTRLIMENSCAQVAKRKASMDVWKSPIQVPTVSIKLELNALIPRPWIQWMWNPQGVPPFFQRSLKMGCDYQVDDGCQIFFHRKCLEITILHPSCETTILLFLKIQFIIQLMSPTIYKWLGTLRFQVFSNGEEKQKSPTKMVDDYSWI